MEPQTNKDKQPKDILDRLDEGLKDLFKKIDGLEAENKRLKEENATLKDSLGIITEVSVNEEKVKDDAKLDTLILTSDMEVKDEHK